MTWHAAGIDFGNRYCVIGITREGGVDIINNQCSNRLTPSLVTFTNTRRYPGEAALQHRMQYIENSISHIKQLISLPYGNDRRRFLGATLPYKMVQLSDGFTGVVVQYQDKEITMRPEQVIACLFRDLSEICHLANPKIDRYVVSVPQWWNERQRRTILSAMKLAEMPCMSLVNSTTAAAVAYEHRWRAKLDPKSDKYVMFVDIGDSAMNVSVAKLRPNSVEIVSSGHDLNVSGHNFTYLLYGLISKEVQSRYKIDVRDLNPRATQRFYDAVEKTKKNFAVNSVVQFECHSLTPEVDAIFPVKRDDFLALTDGVISGSLAVFDRVLSDAKLKKEQLMTIELLGGCSRIISIKQKLRDYFGKETTSTLNLDECFAFGCGLCAASLNPKATQKLSVKDILTSDILIQEDDKAPTVLFRRGTQIPVRLTNRMLLANTSVLKVISEGEVISTCSFQIDKRGRNPTSVTFSINCSMIFNVTVERSSKCFSSVPLGLSVGEQERLLTMEKDMANGDKAEKHIDELKNEIESLIYEFQNAIQRDYPEYFPASVIDNAVQLVDTMTAWLESNSEKRLEASEYEKKAKDIKDILEPAKRRRRIYREAADQGDSYIDRARRAADGCRRSGNAKAASLAQSLDKAVENIRTLMTQRRDVTPTTDITTIVQFIASVEKWLAKK